MKSTTTSASASSSRSDVERGIGAAAELEVVGFLDRLADGLPHAPGGAADRDPDHAASASETDATAPRKRSSPGPMHAAESESGS